MKENVKEQLVKVAQEVFKKFGYRKTTMDEIAHAARKGKSSLYYYFKSKEEVYQAVVQLEAEALKSEIRLKVDEQPDAKLKLRHYIISRMCGFKKMSNFYVAIKDDYLSNLDFIEKIRAKYDKEETESLKSILQNGIDTKLFKNIDVELSARVISKIMKGLEISILIRKEEVNVEAVVDEVLNILFTGINY